MKTMKFWIGIVALGSGMFWLLIACVGTVLAQQSACTKACMDPVDGPCSGLTGKAFAQCLGQCVQACKPHPPPPPLLDPGCTDATIQGKIKCTILTPNVSVPEMDYSSSVRFVPGDVVDVQADGCVQTGGHGATWKRYVNPLGDGIDTKYHGLIRIPTARPAGSGLVRILTVIGRLQTVMGDPNVPPSQMGLHLGYEDDDYSDNGYYSHDDGNLGQCSSYFGGGAHVTITIYRGNIKPDPPQSRFDFDVLSNDQDRNGLLLNPKWSWQLRPENQGEFPKDAPNTSLCNDFMLPGGAPPFNQSILDPVACTDQTDLNNIDSGNICGTHINWFPVTMDGRAQWGNHELPFPLGDDDYTYNFFPDPPGNALSVNGRDALHIEMDSDETIDNFQSEQEWQWLRNAVDSGDKSRISQLFDGRTVVTGLFGLDGQHDWKPELHPLYAMATRRDNFENDPLDDVWLMFARNRGDEGYCSSHLWDAGFEDYTVRLPWREGMTWVDVNWSKTHFSGSPGTSGPTVSRMLPTPTDPGGVFVSFHLGPAPSTPLVFGVLHLIWTGTPLEAMHSAASIAAAAKPAVEQEVEEADEFENMMKEASVRLTAAQRTSITNASRSHQTRPQMHELSQGSVQTITKLPPSAILLGTRPSPATAKIKRDAAGVRMLCAATKNAPPGLPATACPKTPQKMTAKPER